MSPKAVVRMPGEGRQISLAGKPLVFLVTGQDTKHTSMFDWTLPAGFSTGTHVHQVQEETFYVLEGECEWQIRDQPRGREQLCRADRLRGALDPHAVSFS